MAKGVISQLQEFVQGSKRFPAPPSCPILQWTYDTHMAESGLEFRATVAFLLDGVPHHIVGAWHQSKKLAQRDAAERSLGFFVGCWGECAGLELDDSTDSGSMSLSNQGSSCGDSSDSDLDVAAETYSSSDEGPAIPAEVCALEAFCRSALNESAPPPHWSHSWDHDSGSCRGFVTLELLGVPHTFPSKPCESEEAATADAARRVLWYLQCPGYENAFEPDRSALRSLAQDIPSPHQSWAKDRLVDQ